MSTDLYKDIIRNKEKRNKKNKWQMVIMDEKSNVVEQIK